MDILEQTTEAHVNKQKRPKRLTSFFLLGMILIASLAAGYQYVHRYIPGKITFQEYMPSYLPQGVAIKEKHITATYSPGSDPSRYTTLDVSLNHGFIYAEKNTRNFIYKCPVGTIINQTCLLKMTPHGQGYMLTATISPESAPTQLYSQAVDLLKGDTLIRINLDRVGGEGYAQSEIEKVIDSLQPVHYEGLQVRYVDHSSV